jgi:hypothetical protein
VGRISRTNAGLNAWFRASLTNPKRGEILQHLSKGPDIAEGPFAPKPHVCFVILRFETLDVVGIHNPVKPPDQVENGPATRETHAGLRTTAGPAGTGGRFRERAVAEGNELPRQIESLG